MLELAEQPGLRVLIIEDNDAQRRVLAALMREEGFFPVTCTSGAEALRAVEQADFAVAIVDHRLPDMDSTEILAHGALARRGIRTIIHTGYGSFESAKEAVNRGAFAYVEKLGDPEELIRHVHRAVQDWMAAALQRSQEHYRHLVESVGAVVWRSQPELLRNTFVSREAEAMLGYPIAQWLTEPFFWHNHIHPGDRAHVVASFEQAVREKRSHELEYRMIAADGRVIWVRDLIKVLVADGKPVELVGVMVDITERKRLEKEILEISGREQRRIGQDLHDELGQLLTGIGFRVAELEGDLRREAVRAADDAAEIVQMVEKAIAQTRALARGLSPVDVERQGLASALRELTLNVEKIYGIACPFEYLHPVHVGDLAVATQVYRIAQESITNAIKHAGASRIEVKLAAQGEEVALSVYDDGSGIAPAGSRNSGLGLHIMEYRAGMIGGTLEVYPAPGSGTVVTCRFSASPVHPSIE